MRGRKSPGLLGQCGRGGNLHRVTFRLSNWARPQSVPIANIPVLCVESWTDATCLPLTIAVIWSPWKASASRSQPLRAGTVPDQGHEGGDRHFVPSQLQLVLLRKILLLLSMA